MTQLEAMATINIMCKSINDSNQLKALEMAMRSFDNQIPKKPNIHGIREGREINTVSYTCPVCNEHIGRDRYCKHCGQALDWGDTE